MYPQSSQIVAENRAVYEQTETSPLRNTVVKSVFSESFMVQSLVDVLQSFYIPTNVLFVIGSLESLLQNP